MTSRMFKPMKPRPYGTPKEAVVRLFKEAGGVEAVRVRLGLSLSQLYRFTEAESDQAIGFDRVAALTAPDATAGAEYLAHLAGCLLLPIAGAESDDPVLKVTGRAAVEFGELVQRITAALADGVLTGREARQALAELDDVLRPLAELRRRLVEAIGSPQAAIAVPTADALSGAGSHARPPYRGSQQ